MTLLDFVKPNQTDHTIVYLTDTYGNRFEDFNRNMNRIIKSYVIEWDEDCNCPIIHIVVE